MASKFEKFLKDGTVDPRRLLVASSKIERQHDEQPAKPTESESGKEASAKPRKRARGRPVTPRLLQAALQGKPLSGPAKTRLLQALNHVLTQKKKSTAELRQIF